MTVLIAGNGASLKDINYDLFPKNVEIYRSNQFYFEDKYYLGDKVSRYFINPQIALAQYFTKNKLHQNNEYNFEKCVLANYKLTSMNETHQNYLHDLMQFSDFEFGLDTLKKLPQFLDFIRFEYIFNNNLISSTLYMSAYAVAQGHKTIYLTGLDFYRDHKYAFDAQSQNIKKLGFDMYRKHTEHSEFIDVKALQFLMQHYGVTFYSISPTSPVSEYIEIAPQSNNDFVIKTKPNNYIKDIQIPDELTYEKYNLTDNKNPYYFNKQEKQKGLRKFFIRNNKESLRRSIKNLRKDILSILKHQHNL